MEIQDKAFKQMNLGIDQSESIVIASMANNKWNSKKQKYVAR